MCTADGNASLSIKFGFGAMKSGVSSYLIYSDLDAFINFFRVSPQPSGLRVVDLGLRR